MPNGNLCPLWSQYVNEAAKTPDVIQHWETFTAPLLKRLSPILGYNATNWGDFQQIHDCLVVHSCHDQPIPAGVTQELYDLVFILFYFIFLKLIISLFFIYLINYLFY